MIDPGGTAPARRVIRRGTRPSWSPDGKRLAIERSVGRQTNIFIARANGKKLRRLTYRGGTKPVWSPDGRWILFQRNPALMVVRTDGRRLRTVTRNAFEYDADWQALPQVKAP